MIPFDLISILVIAGTVGLFIALFVVSKLINKKLKRDWNGYTSYFPSELYGSKEKLNHAYKILNYVYAGIGFGGIIIVLPHLYDFSNVGILAIVIAAVAGITTLVQLVLKVIPVFFVKQHILVSSIYMTSVTMELALTSFFGILLFNIYNETHEASFVTLTFAILSGLLTLVSLVIMFNPRLKDWARLANISNNKEEKEFARPKFFPLAFSEWLFIVLNFLGLILFFLTLIRI